MNTSLPSENTDSTENSVSTRCGFVALIGAPNAGKSTLLNQMVGQKVAIVTPKVQTTRNRITGICMQGNAQIIFVDTPGIFNAKAGFEQAMVKAAWSGSAEADVTLLLIDAKKGICPNSRAIIDRLKEQRASGQGNKPLHLILNKVDTVEKHELLMLAQSLYDEEIFGRIYMISALKGDGVEDIREFLAESLPASPWLYPEDQASDLPSRLLASEITREKLFMRLQHELPYELTVETEQWKPLKDGSVRMEQVIYVQRESQKKIVIGKSGDMLKKIGQIARREMEHLWGHPIHLFLFVKVRENWKENPETYRYLGLDRV